MQTLLFFSLTFLLSVFPISTDLTALLLIPPLTLVRFIFKTSFQNSKSFSNSEIPSSDLCPFLCFPSCHILPRRLAGLNFQKVTNPPFFPPFGLNTHTHSLTHPQRHRVYTHPFSLLPAFLPTSKTTRWWDRSWETDSDSRWKALREWHHSPTLSLGV